MHRRALALLALSRGERVAHVAQLLDVSKQSVLRWRDAWQKNQQVDALEDRARPGRPREWTEDREELLLALLERSPAQLGYRAMCWTSHLLSNSLEQIAGWRPSDRSMRLELRELGYVYKRPRYVLEPDPQLAKKSP
jgi:transposase